MVLITSGTNQPDDKMAGFIYTIYNCALVRKEIHTSINHNTNNQEQLNSDSFFPEQIKTTKHFRRVIIIVIMMMIIIIIIISALSFYLS